MRAERDVARSSLTLRETDDAGTAKVTVHEKTYTVALEREPTGDVTVAVTLPTRAKVTATQTTLTFTRVETGAMRRR